MTSPFVGSLTFKGGAPTKCEECGAHELCGFCNRCPGQSFIEHGTPLKASTANCQSANARMNLTKKLMQGNASLQGNSLEQRLLNFQALELTEFVSIKDVSNYRNKRSITALISLFSLKEFKY